MFRSRRGFVRIAAGAVAAASCLAVTACGGAPADPLAALTASKVAAEATADAEAASSLTVDGTLSQSGKSYTVDIGIKRGQGCTGTIGIGGVGSIKLTVIGQTAYFDGDAEYWKTVTASDTSVSAKAASAAVALLDGRYIEAPMSNVDMAGLGELCTVSKLLNSDTTPSTFTKEAVTTLDGTRVLPLKSSDGSTDYVTDTSKPEFVEAFAPKGAKVGAGKVTVSVGAPVRLAAPPASQVVNGAALGM
jgi:hypothetical protein